MRFLEVGERKRRKEGEGRRTKKKEGRERSRKRKSKMCETVGCRVQTARHIGPRVTHLCLRAIFVFLYEKATSQVFRTVRATKRTA